MGFSINKNSRKKRHSISEINITPFVDVLLVLLIIFMIAAPMMTSGIDVSLPKGSGDPTSEKTKPISVTIKQDGTIFVEEDLVKISFLSSKLMERTDKNLDSKIHVKADQGLDYGRVMNVVKQINESGFSKVILVTELVE
jgi:biopolymer transport protein TolR